MSRTRTLVLFLIGIALVVGLHLLVDVQTASAPHVLRSNALLPDADEAMTIEIRRKDEPKTVLSLDVDEGWRIVAPYNAPADWTVILRLADALAFVPARDEMTDAELLRLGRTRSDFGLESPRVSVEIVREGGRRTTVSFGGVTPTGDGVYATVGEGNTVRVVPTNVLAVADLGANAFRRRNFFDRTSDQVVAADVKGASEHFFRLVRENEGWKVSEPYVSVATATRVQSFLDDLLALRAQDFVWPVGGSNETAIASASLLAGYGLDPESSVTVTVKCLDGQDIMVSFGRMLGQDRAYAQMPDGSIAVVLMTDSIRMMRKAGVTAFVDTRLFPLEAPAVTTLSMDDGGTIYLLSRATDGAWRLDAPISASADRAAVENLLKRLLALRTADADSAGVCVSVGTNAVPVSVSRAALLGGLRMEDLRSREILNIAPADLKRLVVTEGDGRQTSVVFDAENRTWAVESAQGTVSVDREAVDRLAAELNPLTAVRIERLKVLTADLGLYGLDNPFRTIAIDQTGEKSVRRNVRIGDVTNGGRYATFGSADAIFVISTESATSLLAPLVK